MYTVEDELFQRARSILSALAGEVRAQQALGVSPVDLQKLVRGAAQIDLPQRAEADYVHPIADRLERSLPISELFPRHRRDRTS